jgi:acetyltransferase-like isoleucine patch superfamily enzyme
MKISLALKYSWIIMVALMPSVLKRFVFRFFFKFEVGRNPRIGFSFFDVGHMKIGDDVRIGHFNLFIGTKEVEIGRGVDIGHFNLFRGGDLVSVGEGSKIQRFNVINSIPDPVCTTHPTPVFEMGGEGFISSGHRLDFTDSFTMGGKCIIGGRNSSFWTHNRFVTKPVQLGSSCVFLSEVRCAPGTVIPNRSIVAMGAVVVHTFSEEGTVIGGVPAKVVKKIGKDEELMIA